MILAKTKVKVHMLEKSQEQELYITSKTDPLMWNETWKGGRVYLEHEAKPLVWFLVQIDHKYFSYDRSGLVVKEGMFEYSRSREPKEQTFISIWA